MSVLQNVIRCLERWPELRGPRQDLALVLAIVPGEARADLAAYELYSGQAVDPSQYTGLQLCDVHVMFNPVLPRDLMQMIVKAPEYGDDRIALDIDLGTGKLLRRYRVGAVENPLN